MKWEDKIVILAAGEGSRLRPYTQNQPKCMVPFRGKPMLNWALDAFSALGIGSSNIRVVSGYCSDVLINTLREYGVSDVVYNSEYSKTNMVYSLSLALVGVEDLVVCYSDIVWEQAILERLLESPHEVSVVVDQKWFDLWSIRMSDPLADAETLKVSEQGLITEIGNKPKSLDEIEAQYIGMVRIRGRSLQRLKDKLSDLQKADEAYFRKMYFTDLLQLMIREGYCVYPVFIQGGWVEIDTVDDLVKLETYSGLKRGLYGGQ